MENLKVYLHVSCFVDFMEKNCDNRNILSPINSKPE